MAKYLDYAGLQYLWTKIKNYVSTQPLGANVRYDVQSLTNAQKEQARQNIAAGSTNPNLLVNGYFVGVAGKSFPINSRGQTTYTGSTWTVDCWRTWDGGTTVTVGSSGLTFSNNLNGDALFQYIQEPTYLYGKQITISAIINNKLYSATGVASSSAWIATADEDVYSLRFSVDNVSGYGYVCVQIVSGKTITIEAIKLEIGAVSTIVGDVPPDRELEYIRSVSYPVFYGDTVAGRAITPTSNRNLLDNAYFVGGGSQLGDGVFPINQRGQSSYIGMGNHFDRWRGETYYPSITLAADGVKFCSTTSGQFGTMVQYLAKECVIAGKTVTISAIIDGTLASTTYNVPASGGYDLTPATVGDIAFNLYSPNGTDIQFRFYTTTATAHTIAAAKLEEGTVSTLANDPPPKFGGELRECQRYLLVLDIPSYFLLGEFAVAVDATNGAFVLRTPVEMAKTNPLVTISGDLQVSGVGAITSTPWATKFGGRVCVAFVTSGTMVANTIYPIGVGASARITVSAEL